MTLCVFLHSVKAELAPFGEDAVEYERNKLALSISVQHTTALLSPIILKHMNVIGASITEDKVREIHFELIWDLVTNVSFLKLSETPFTLPETLRLDASSLLKLAKDLSILTKYAIAYQAINRICNKGATLRSFAQTFEQNYMEYDEGKIMEWVRKNLQFSEIQLDLLMPLIRARQCESHPSYEYALKRLYEGMWAEKLHGSISTEWRREWLAMGSFGHSLKHWLWKVIEHNFLVYRERYQEIAQGIVNQARMTVV